MPTTLPLIPLDDVVVFPTMDVTLPVDPGDEERVLLVPRIDGEFAAVGTIAHVEHITQQGDLAVLADFGIPEEQMQLVCSEDDLYPDEQLQTIAETAGFESEFLAAVDTLDRD